MSMKTEAELKELQSLPFRLKIVWAEGKIQEWHEHWEGDTIVSFSGGIDSVVLLHLVRSMYPNTKAVFVDTGVEYPEIPEFVKTVKNIIWLKPEKSFWEVIEQYGWPIVSKRQASYIKEVRRSKSKDLIRLRMTGIKSDGDRYRSGSKISNCWQFLVKAPFRISDQCCYFLKIKPIRQYNEKHGNPKHFLGMKASDSEQRRLSWKLGGGCNAFDKKEPTAWPLAIWTTSDVLEYILLKKVPYCQAIYGQIKKIPGIKYCTTGYQGTGCMYCGFGLHMPRKQGKENHLQMLAKSHPRHYDLIINKKGMGRVLDFAKLPYKPRKEIGFFVNRKPK